MACAQLAEVKAIPAIANVFVSGSFGLTLVLVAIPALADLDESIRLAFQDEFKVVT